MKFISLMFVLLLTASSIGYTQPIDTIFTKTLSYAPYGDVIGYEMVKYNSNEFIVTGRSGDSLYIVNMTSNGNIVWQKYLSADGGLFGAAIDKDANGNFYIVCWKGNSSNQWQLIKFNSSGDSLWSYTMQDQVNSFNIPYSLMVSSDYIYAASSAGNGPERYALYKFSPDGDLLFSRMYAPGDFNIPRSITHDSNGNVIMTGTGGIGWYVLKCNSDGDTLWSRTATDNFWNNEARTVITDNNDNIICSGWVNKIIKYDPSGNLIYDKPLGDNNNWESASLIKYDNANMISIGALRRSNGMTYDLLLGKYSIDTGDSIWTKIWYYPDAAFGVYGWDGAVFFDSSLIVLGQTYTNVSGNFFSNIYIMSFSLADIPVPVEMMSFNAAADNKNVILNWVTATETNNKGFEIERSQGTDVRNWKKIGYLAGSGTVTEPKTYSFTDMNVASGIYSYRLKQIDYDGSFNYSAEVQIEVNAPGQFSLSQNYPNPFNPTTQINYSIPKDGFVSLRVYNTLGQLVADLVNREVKAGTYKVDFDATKLSSGVYYYRIETNGFVNTKKMTLIR